MDVTEQTPITKEDIVCTIRTNNLPGLKILAEISPEEFHWLKNDSINLLLSHILQENQKEMFQFMLQFQDTDSRQRALRYILNFSDKEHEYYIHELIKDGVQIHGHNLESDLLHWAVDKSCLNLTKFLLEAGVDPNIRDGSGRTPLYKIFEKPENRYEFVCMLLYYEADPSIEFYRGYNLFEIAIRDKYPVFLQEILFFYTFDDELRSEILSDILLALGKQKSTFFYEILSYDVEILINDTSGEFWNTLYDVLTIDLVDLQLLLDKHTGMIRNVFEKCNNEIFNPNYRKRDRSYLARLWQSGIYTILEDHNVLINLDYLYENKEELRHHIHNFCLSLDISKIFEALANVNAHDQIFYLLTRGLRADSYFVDTIFEECGYCPLFKLLLHLELKTFSRKKHALFLRKRNSVVALIREVNTNVKTFFRNLQETMLSVEDLLDYSAHPELIRFLSNLSEYVGRIKLKGIRSRLETHPRVPRLVELSRNASRDYLVERHSILTTRKFYRVVNALEIPSFYKKILTLETKLYEVINKDDYC
ncbi:uncharacterized protein LOC135125483 [Zophobas morio]|uniref:uncharacterized protein LOC135125483 n=1 Tax=Zophobas morio TaxID=2755281 RepID=UPI003083ED06